MLPSPELKKVTVSDYLNIILRNSWIVVLCAAISIVAAIVVFTAERFPGPVVYETKATILVEEHPTLKTVNIEGISESKGMNAGVLAEHIQAPEFAQRVAEKLDRSDSWELLSMVTVERRESTGKRESNIIDIIVQGRRPPEVAKIANTWVEEIIEEDIESKMESSQYGSAWLDANRDEIGKKLHQAEMELQTFKEANEGVEFRAKAVERLRTQKEDLEAQKQELLLKYKEKHPEIVSIDRRIEIIEDQMKEVYSAEQGDEEEYEAKVLQYNLLSQQAATLRALYDKFARASEEAEISKDLILPSVQVLRKAAVPNRPVPKELPRSRAFDFVIYGLFIGVGLSLLKEYLDTSLKTAEEVEFYAKMPFLGYIPSMRGKVKSGKDMHLLTHRKPGSQMAEAFRNIKVSLIFAAPVEKFLKTVMVSSAVPKEGKSCVASNLAITFAQAKEETLLIDGDMRQGDLVKNFEVKNKYGLSDMLDGKCGLDEALLSTSIPNLSLLCAGEYVPNPTDLLAKEKFNELLEKVKGKFQRIVVDVPSILKYNDALFWGDKCDGMVFVVGAGSTPLNAITAATKKIEGKMNVVGGVLNSAAVEKDFYYYYHYFESYLEKELEKAKETAEKIKKPSQ